MRVNRLIKICILSIDFAHARATGGGLARSARRRPLHRAGHPIGIAASCASPLCSNTLISTAVWFADRSLAFAWGQQSMPGTPGTPGAALEPRRGIRSHIILPLRRSHHPLQRSADRHWCCGGMWVGNDCRREGTLWGCLGGRIDCRATTLWRPIACWLRSRRWH